MLKFILRLIAYLILLTLPITLPPFLHAAISGLLWAPWNSRHVTTNSERYLHELKDVLSDWGVGGDAPTFSQFQDTNNDFHLTRINTHDWLLKLGFILPKEYTNHELEFDTPIDKAADLSHLMRDVEAEGNRCVGKDVPREQWLYFSDFAWPMWNAWDGAWDEIVQQAYADPKLNKTALHFAQCARSAGFLCGVWSTRAPALVHFLIEEDEVVYPGDIEEGLTYDVPARQLRPVKARIIEFPLEEEWSGIPLSTFPSEKEQMLAIMTGDRLYEQWEPYDDPIIQMWKRFNDHLELIWNARGTFLYRLNKVDDWMREEFTDHIGITDYVESFRSFNFWTAVVISQTVWPIVTLIDELWGLFIGRPLPGDRILGDIPIEETPEDRFWGPLFDGFQGFVEQKMSEQASATPGEGADEARTSASSVVDGFWGSLFTGFPEFGEQQKTEQAKATPSEKVDEARPTALSMIEDLLSSMRGSINGGRETQSTKSGNAGASR